LLCKNLSRHELLGVRKFIGAVNAPCVGKDDGAFRDELALIMIVLRNCERDAGWESWAPALGLVHGSAKVGKLVHAVVFGVGTACCAAEGVDLFVALVQGSGGLDHCWEEREER